MATTETPSRPALPYGPLLSRLLRPIQRGFLVLNGLVVQPAIRIGLGRFIGNPLSGHLMLLRTRGRRTGQRREVPLGYVIRDGAILCVAGFGKPTPWYLNLLANPTVEVRLPDRTIRGVATPIEDDREWLDAYRALIASFGIVGRLAAGDVARLTDEELLARHRSLPVVRIRALDPPGPVTPGKWDDGPLGAVVIAAWLSLAVLVLVAVLGTRRR